MSKRLSLVLALFCFALLATQAFALHGTTRTRRATIKKTSHRHRRIPWNPMFKGSHEMLVRENVHIDELQLPRINNDEELEEIEASEELVPVAGTDSLWIAGNLQPNRRYCRPWTRDFLNDFSQAFYEEFHKQIQVTSLVRTAEQQKKLRRRNRNAAPQDGETASTHMTGTTVDILKRGLTKKEKKWIEAYFLPLKNRGAIDPIEERRQPVFHVMVYYTYNDKYQTYPKPPVVEPVVESQAVPAILLETEPGTMPQLGAQD